MSVGDYIRNSQVWKSIFRHPAPVDRRNRSIVMLTNFFLHLHPVSIKKEGIALSYTWCMGGITFFLFLVETLTGVLLMFYYRPTLEWAFNDILALRDVQTLGIMREIHRWGAHAMVITVWLHMYRVFLTGSYKPPREFNWVVGVLLVGADVIAVVYRVFIALGSVGDLGDHGGFQHGPRDAFPGERRAGAQILNVGGFDLITSASDARFILLGGRFVGEATLNRFYILHCVAIPLVVAGLIAIHFWRVRKDGGISQPL